jgi:hypothetical protein
MQSLFDALNEWLRSVYPSMKWIVAEQGTVPPTPENENFGLVRIVSSKRQGIDGSLFKYDVGLDKFHETAASVRDITVSIDVFTVDRTAEDILQTVMTALQTQNVQDIFSSRGFGTLGYTDLINLSTVISGRYARRFRTELSVGANAIYSTLLDRIVTVPYQGTVDTTIITGEVNT